MIRMKTHSRKEEIKDECKQIEKDLQKIIDAASAECRAITLEEYITHIANLSTLKKEWEELK